MGKRLIICDKPSVAKRIVTHPNLTNTKRFKSKDNYLYGYYENEEYIVSWTFGNMFEFKRWMEINPKYDFPFKFELLPILEPIKYKIKKSDQVDYSHQLSLLLWLMKRNDVIEIINACDFDKEGEVVFKMVYTLYKSQIPEEEKPKPIARLIIKSYDRQSLIEAFKNIDRNNSYRGLEEAGILRSKMDYYLGDTLTRCLTYKLGNNEKWISSGRVQLALLYEIYKRESLIKSFRSHKYYGVSVNSTLGSIKMVVDQTKNYIIDKEYMQGIVNNLQNTGYLIIKDYEKKREYRVPPRLFSTTDLYYYMTLNHNILPEETNTILHRDLYEGGYITFPRTDSNYLSVSQKQTVLELYRKFTEVKDEKIFYSSQNFNDKFVNSHHAIIPTFKDFEYGKNPKTDLIYAVIKDRFIQAFMPNAIIEKRKIILKDQYGHEYSIDEQTVIDKGWLEEAKDEKIKTDFTLPEVSVGDLIEVSEVKLTGHRTKRPARYNVASILNFMKNPLNKKEGEYEEHLVQGFRIGTPATEHTFISSLERNELIEIKDKKIYLTNKGRAIIEKTKLEIYKTPNFTAEIEVSLNKLTNNFSEDYLKLLEQRIRDYCVDIVNDFKDIPQQLIEVNVEDLGFCPKCKSKLRKSPKAYICNNRDNCNFYIPKYICNKFISEKIVGELLTLQPTSRITGFVSQRTGRRFSAKLKYNPSNNRVEFIFNNKGDVESE